MGTLRTQIKRIKAQKGNNTMRIRDGYSTNYEVLLNYNTEGLDKIWTIETPSSQKYKIIKPLSIDLLENNVEIQDGYGFRAILHSDSVAHALHEIYEWEQAGVTKNPDLKDKTTIMQILNAADRPDTVLKLQKMGSLVLDLQTAVYLFTSKIIAYKDTMNSINLSAFFAVFVLSKEDTITLCRYAISKDTKYIESFPKRLLSEAMKDGSIHTLVTPSADGIDPIWTKFPHFGNSVL